MKFAEFSVGQVIHCGPASLTERQITDFARDYDPQWFHTDPQRAADSTWQGLIASGWQSCGVAMRMVCDEILADSESFGSPGLAYLKWENPVRPGDALKLHVDVLDDFSAAKLGIVSRTSQSSQRLWRCALLPFCWLLRSGCFHSSLSRRGSLERLVSAPSATLEFRFYRGPGFMMLGDSGFAKRYRQNRPDIWEKVQRKLRGANGVFSHAVTDKANEKTQSQT